MARYRYAEMKHSPDAMIGNTAGWPARNRFTAIPVNSRKNGMAPT